MFASSKAFHHTEFQVFFDTVSAPHSLWHGHLQVITCKLLQHGLYGACVNTGQKSCAFSCSVYSVYCLESGWQFSITLTSTVALVYVNWELVLLVAAHVCVTHEEQCVAVFAGRRRNELQPHLGLLLQCQALYWHKVVHLHVSNHHPPALLTFLHSSTNRLIISRWNCQSMTNHTTPQAI